MRLSATLGMVLMAAVHCAAVARPPPKEQSQSLKALKELCVDSTPECATWADGGECLNGKDAPRSAKWMQTNCAKSCKPDCHRYHSRYTSSDSEL